MPNGRMLFLPFALVLAGAATLLRGTPLSVASPNDNRKPAGRLKAGVLAISLEAKRTIWYPDGDSLPGLEIEAFAEAGQEPTAPGPLLRMPSGTEIHASIRNLLERDTITFYIPAKIDGSTRDVALDSIVVPPGEARELRVRAVRPGSYVYRANANTRLDKVLRMRGFLAGALIVDSAGAAGPPKDRVFVLLDAVDSLTPAGVPDTDREIPSVNGRSWPHTERLAATVGDTLVWRVLNASPGVHPMHLHGFYYRVDDFDGPQDLQPSQAIRPRMSVTERMTPFTTMSMTWVPERAGNWLFHCHFQPHVMPHRPLGASNASPRSKASSQHAHASNNHAYASMNGLVMGIHVAPRPGQRIAEPATGRRQLRLVALSDSGFPDSLPSMRFELQERGSSGAIKARAGFSPTIELKRGEPVSITVVNRLGEATSVHWHGIELESYFDGVVGFRRVWQASGSTYRPARFIRSSLYAAAKWDLHLSLARQRAEAASRWPRRRADRARWCAERLGPGASLLHQVRARGFDGERSDGGQRS